MLAGFSIGATRPRDMRNLMAVSFVINCAWRALALVRPETGLITGCGFRCWCPFVARGVRSGLRYHWHWKRAAEFRGHR